MTGYITRKGNNWYAVIYDGIDPDTGRERRRWHPAGPDRDTAETLARQLGDEARARNGTRSRLTLAGHVERTWLPRKDRQLLPATLDGYRRQLRLYILPDLGPIALRALRPETIEACFERLLTSGRADGTGGLSTKSVLETHVLLRQILDDAVSRGLIPANSARHAVPPRHRRDQHRRRMAWTAAELTAFLDATLDHSHPPHMVAHRTHRCSPLRARRSALARPRPRAPTTVDHPHHRGRQRPHAHLQRQDHQRRTHHRPRGAHHGHAELLATAPPDQVRPRRSSPTTVCSSTTTATRSTRRASPRASTAPLHAPDCRS